MSGCADVCLDMGYDFDPSDFFREKPVTAKLRHHCCECGRVIEPGKRYERATGKCDGVFWSYATCADRDYVLRAQARSFAVRTPPHLSRR